MSSLRPIAPSTSLEPEDATAARLEEMGGGGLRRRAARGTIVNALFMVGVNGLSVVKYMLVARMLGAEEYGLWGLLTISFGTLFWLAGIGLDDKYIQQDHPNQRHAFEIAFTLQAMLCLVLTLAAVVGIPLFSLLYDQPEILVPGLVAAIAMPAIALQTPIWVFYRRMDFLRQRLLQSFEPVVSFIVTIALAVAGWGVWSLVVGTLAGSLVAGAVAVRSSPYPLRFRYERGSFREYATFSWPLFAGSASTVLALQIPVVVAARSLGTAAVGAIALTASITSYTRRVDDIVTTSLYPAICAVKDRTELLFETFSKSNRLALLWGFPFGVGAALFAEDFVRFALGGGDWDVAVPLIQVLGLAAAFDQIGFNWTAFARARAETRPLGVAGVLLLVVVLAVGVPLMLSEGIDGYAIALAVGTAAGMLVRFWYLLRLFPALKVGAHIGRAMAPTVPAAGLVLLERAVVGGGPSVARALGEAAAFVLVVALASYLAERTLLRESVGYLRRDRGEAPAPAS